MHLLRYLGDRYGAEDIPLNSFACYKVFVGIREAHLKPSMGGLLIRYTIPLIAFIWVYMAHIATENSLCSVIATYWKQEAASSSLVRLKGDVTNINVLTWRIDEYLLRLMVDLLQAK